MFRCQIMLLSVSVFGCEFVALLDSGASRVFVGQVGWRKLEALGFKLRRTSVEPCTLASNSNVGVRGFINERTRPTAHREHRQQVRSHSVPESSTGVVRQGLLPQDARFSVGLYRLNHT
jgi:hypothetical protein